MRHSYTCTYTSEIYFLFYTHLRLYFEYDENVCDIKVVIWKLQVMHCSSSHISEKSWSPEQKMGVFNLDLSVRLTWEALKTPNIQTQPCDVRPTKSYSWEGGCGNCIFRKFIFVSSTCSRRQESQFQGQPHAGCSAVQYPGASAQIPDASLSCWLLCWEP